MNKTELISAISSEASVSKKEAKVMLASLCTLIKEALKKGEEVKINGFGKFEVKKRNERVVINPATKQKMILPSVNKASFKASSDLTGAVN